MVTDPASALAIDRQRQIPDQSHAPEQPQGVVQQIGLTDGAQAARGQILESLAGIDQDGPCPALGQGQGDGINAVITPLQVRRQRGSLLPGQIHGPAAEYKPGDGPIPIKNHNACSMASSQGLGQADRLHWYY